MGTLDEWIKHNPNTQIRNDLFMYPGSYLTFPEKLEESKLVNVPMGRRNSPLITFFDVPKGQAVSITTDEVRVHYQALLINIYGGGHTVFLNEKQAKSDQWYEEVIE